MQTHTFTKKKPKKRHNKSLQTGKITRLPNNTARLERQERQAWACIAALQKRPGINHVVPQTMNDEDFWQAPDADMARELQRLQSRSPWEAFEQALALVMARRGWDAYGRHNPRWIPSNIKMILKLVSA